MSPRGKTVTRPRNLRRTPVRMRVSSAWITTETPIGSENPLQPQDIARMRKKAAKRRARDLQYQVEVLERVEIKQEELHQEQRAESDMKRVEERKANELEKRRLQVEAEESKRVSENGPVGNDEYERDSSCEIVDEPSSEPRVATEAPEVPAISSSRADDERPIRRARKESAIETIEASTAKFETPILPPQTYLQQRRDDLQRSAKRLAPETPSSASKRRASPEASPVRRTDSIVQVVITTAPIQTPMLAAAPSSIRPVETPSNTPKPVPKRGRGRPRKHPLPTSSTDRAGPSSQHDRKDAIEERELYRENRSPTRLDVGGTGTPTPAPHSSLPAPAQTGPSTQSKRPRATQGEGKRTQKSKAAEKRKDKVAVTATETVAPTPIHTQAASGQSLWTAVNQSQKVTTDASTADVPIPKAPATVALGDAATFPATQKQDNGKGKAIEARKAAAKQAPAAESSESSDSSEAGDSDSDYEESAHRQYLDDNTAGRNASVLRPPTPNQLPRSREVQALERRQVLMKPYADPEPAAATSKRVRCQHRHISEIPPPIFYGTKEAPPPAPPPRRKFVHHSYPPSEADEEREESVFDAKIDVVSGTGRSEAGEGCESLLRFLATPPATETSLPSVATPSCQSQERPTQNAPSPVTEADLPTPPATDGPEPIILPPLALQVEHYLAELKVGISDQDLRAVLATLLLRLAAREN